MNQVEDVEIILARERRYKFHSGVLARNSTLFLQLLTQKNAAKLSKEAQKAGVKIRWMLELTRLPDPDLGFAGQLDLVRLNPQGERHDGRSGIIWNENGRIQRAERAYRQYETILYAFYNKELAIDDTDMYTALNYCIELVNIAEYLGCTILVGKSIEVTLLKHGQTFFQSIAAAPHRWAGLAYSIRSELIFREAMIHIVGDWKRLQKLKSMNDTLRVIPSLRGLVEKYHRALINKVQTLELELMSHYPGKICKPTEDIPIKRDEYSKDILVQMALTFFRHWLGNRLIKDQGRHAIDCGWKLFKAIGAGGEVYLDKTELNKFHVKFPMTQKAFNVLENHLLEIKECMSRIVKRYGLLVSNCQLDIARSPPTYFTCTDFDKKDFPWLKEDAEARAIPPKRVYKASGNEIARENLEAARRMQGRAQERAQIPEDDMEMDEDEDEERDDDEEDDEDLVESPAKRARGFS